MESLGRDFIPSRSLEFTLHPNFAIVRDANSGYPVASERPLKYRSGGQSVASLTLSIVEGGENQNWT